jgi:hypothetical protein
MNAIEQWANEEYREGVSPEAAARQLCRSLGVSGEYPTLKRMLEGMLENSNKNDHDRSAILMDFDKAAPAAASEARLESFRRNN